MHLSFLNTLGGETEAFPSSKTKYISSAPFRLPSDHILILLTEAHICHLLFFIFQIISGMDSLPDATIQYILSHLNKARDVAACNCVSKRWNDLPLNHKSLHFTHKSFDSPEDSPEDSSEDSSYSSDTLVLKMISTCLEELVVYSPFTSAGLASWLLLVRSSLKVLELRVGNFMDYQDRPSKLDCIGVAKNLESLKLWSVLIANPPKWDVFENLRCLEIVGATLEDPALSSALMACPNLTKLVLLDCGGVRTVSIELQYLEQCKLGFYGNGDCSLFLTCPKIELLEVQGCSRIQVRETACLKNLSIANFTVYTIELAKLSALESLSMRGYQWFWDAISKMLECSCEVKNLYVNVTFIVDMGPHLPYPEIHLVEFFNTHPKLEKFDIHGDMLDAFCQENSLKDIDPGFVIPCLEQVVVEVGSQLNAEQELSILESLLKYGKNLKTMVIKMEGSHSMDEFFDKICKLRRKYHKIVRIE